MIERAQNSRQFAVRRVPPKVIAAAAPTLLMTGRRLLVIDHVQPLSGQPLVAADR
jgi:hypothetical protein